MKEPIDGEALASLLTKWIGAEATLWAYELSHKKIVIRLQRTGVRGNLHLVCVATRSLSGPTHWGNAQLEILGEKGPWSVLVDAQSGFTLVCSDIIGTEDVEPVYWAG